MFLCPLSVCLLPWNTTVRKPYLNCRERDNGDSESFRTFQLRHSRQVGLEHCYNAVLSIPLTHTIRSTSEHACRCLSRLFGPNSMNSTYHILAYHMYAQYLHQLSNIRFLSTGETLAYSRVPKLPYAPLVNNHPPVNYFAGLTARVVLLPIFLGTTQIISHGMTDYAEIFFFESEHS